MKAGLVSGLFAATAGDIAVLQAPTLALAPAHRLKLWDLEEKYHCPVIGTCVAVEELVLFARRFEFAADPGDEFALHAEAVGLSIHRNGFAEALQKHLEREYAMALRQFNAARSDDQVREMWRESLARGEVAAPMWATLTHKHASTATRHFIQVALKDVVVSATRTEQAADTVSATVTTLDREAIERRLAIDEADLLRAAAALKPQPELHLRAERSTPYEKVAEVMSASARAGLTRIAFVTNPVTEPEQ